jgi:hypothetical protein
MGFFDDSIVLDSDGVELMFNPYTQIIQIGMGGEWWSGKIKMGTNILKHRKEDIDDCYKPVVISLTEIESSILEIHVSGGFGMEASFKIGDNLPKNKFH